MDHSASATHSTRWFVFLAFALLVGVILRLAYPNDIEYKTDEKYMFEATQAIGVTQPWPQLGMTSGDHFKNPGMSIWVFEILKKITQASTPPQLARAVQWLNIGGLLVLAFFSFYILPQAESEPWRWATVFAAVNPFEVLFDRKIWAQSTLPIFCVLFWIAWHYRKTRTGAFAWGLIGICLGQIHMSGFFLGAGVFLWTLARGRQTRWGAWAAGTLVGLLPMISWLRYMVSQLGHGASGSNFLWILYPKYWLYWVTNPLGLGLTYSLKTDRFMDFLRYPLIGETGTYLVAASNAVILVVGMLLLISVKKTSGFRWEIEDSTDTGLAIFSVLFVTGILMTLCGIQVCRHYLIVAFPLGWVWLSRMALRDSRWGKQYLAALWGAELFISAMFLIYIHVNHGDPTGDYGIAYQFQRGN